MIDKTLGVRGVIISIYLSYLNEKKKKKKIAKFILMEKYLRPERFEANPNSSRSSKEWTHWFKTLENFFLSSESTSDEKLRILINFVSPTIYEYISDSLTFENGIDVLTLLYVKPKNEIFTRHQLATRKQQTDRRIRTSSPNSCKRLQL